MESSGELADYVIVGAGSAGCVLADRLSANSRNRVVLLEAGGDDRPLRNPRQFLTNMFIHMAGGFGHAMKDPRVNWFYQTEKEPDLGDRSFVMSRGKVLGGCSSINGMLYIRGQAADYDGWAQKGCTGWSYDDVLPYFRRGEAQARGEDAYHGIGGPLAVTDFDEPHAISRAVIDACVEAGVPHNPDVNGADQEGASYFQLTARRGRRQSAAVAYLHPAMRRPNLRVIKNALATRVLFEGRRAVAVEYRTAAGLATVRCGREVILAGGAINSPQLLELSGIGEPERLRALGIAPLVDAPAVGENLQDHYSTAMNFRLKKGVASLNERTRGLALAQEVVKYAATGRGLLALAPAQVVIFLKSRPELSFPDIQYHVLPMTIDYEVMRREQRFVMEREPGLTITACQLRPHSRGHVHAVSADPATYPAIRMNFLSDARDRDTAVAGVRWGRTIASQPALARLIDHETSPGAGHESDADLLSHARLTGATLYHPSGTCRMGSDPQSVVDPRLRVRGVGGLRVVDCSIMPNLVSGNTNAPAIMIGEKASDLILADARTAH